jgi:hypothetical protein
LNRGTKKRKLSALMKRLEASRNMEAQSYCFNKGYKIYPIPEGLDYRIQIEYKGQTKLGEKTYSKTEWYDAIWELYDKIYEKSSSSL